MVLLIYTRKKDYGYLLTLLLHIHLQMCPVVQIHIQKMVWG